VSNPIERCSHPARSAVRRNLRAPDNRNPLAGGIIIPACGTILLHLELPDGAGWRFGRPPVLLTRNQSAWGREVLNYPAVCNRSSRVRQGKSVDQSVIGIF